MQEYLDDLEARKGLNLPQRLEMSRRALPYLQKDTKVQIGKGSFAGMTHDKVSSVLRPIFFKYGLSYEIHLSQPEAGVNWVDTIDRYENKKRAVESYVHGVVRITLRATEGDDDNRMVFEAPYGSFGPDDKAPDKAISKGIKTCLLKVMMLPTGVDEEQMPYASSEEQLQKLKVAVNKLTDISKEDSKNLCNSMLEEFGVEALSLIPFDEIGRATAIVEAKTEVLKSQT